MMPFHPYPKSEQARHKRRAPKRKEKGRIKPQTYRAVFDRDGGKCVLCGRTDGLEMHHVIYRSRGGTGEEHNLVLLCKQDHMAAHRSREIRKQLEEHMKRLYPDKWEVPWKA